MQKLTGSRTVRAQKVEERGKVLQPRGRESRTQAVIRRSLRHGRRQKSTRRLEDTGKVEGQGKDGDGGHGDKAVGRMGWRKGKSIGKKRKQGAEMDGKVKKGGDRKTPAVMCVD